MSATKVYKLTGEAYEINEEAVVYSSYEAAYEAAKRWEDFLGEPLDQALDEGMIDIQEWNLV